MLKIDKNIYRVLDANINRTSEGIRVLEDTFRFIKNDKIIFERFRALRHSLDNVLAKAYPSLIRSRDSGGDHGREAKENNFKDINSLVTANFKRVEQSLRVLEEYSRLVSKNANREFKKIRFKVYLLEKSVSEKQVSSLLRPERRA